MYLNLKHETNDCSSMPTASFYYMMMCEGGVLLEFDAEEEHLIRRGQLILLKIVVLVSASLHLIHSFYDAAF